VYSAVGRIKSIKNPNDSVRIRTRDVTACSTVPHRRELPATPQRLYIIDNICVNGRGALAEEH